MRTRTRLIRRTAAAIAVGLVAAGLLTSAPSAATASPALSSGADWTVTSVSGGYQVALSLDDPVPPCRKLSTSSKASARKTTKPTPPGPSKPLCPEQARKSIGTADKSSGSCPAVWQASTR